MTQHNNGGRTCHISLMNLIECVVQDKRGNKEEEQEGRQHKNPRQPLMSCLANEIQHPCPEHDIDKVDELDKHRHISKERGRKNSREDTNK